MLDGDALTLGVWTKLDATDGEGDGGGVLFNSGGGFGCRLTGKLEGSLPNCGVSGNTVCEVDEGEIDGGGFLLSMVEGVETL